MEYTIDYNTGVTEDVTGTLGEAMEVADNGAAYTQCNIDIIDASGVVVATRQWWGVAYDAEVDEAAADEIIDFGNFGYYGAWK